MLHKGPFVIVECDDCETIVYAPLTEAEELRIDLRNDGWMLDDAEVLCPCCAAKREEAK